jgi:hypothetical protein
VQLLKKEEKRKDDERQKLKREEEMNQTNPKQRLTNTSLLLGNTNEQARDHSLGIQHEKPNQNKKQTNQPRCCGLNKFLSSCV